MNLFHKLTVSLGILVLLGMPGEAQINNSLYFMHGVPQANRVNPAHQPQCGFYLGFPMLAPMRVDLSSSSLAYGDVIYPHPTQDSLITFLHPLGNKQAFLDLLKPVNYVSSDLGTSLLSLGVRTPIGFFSLDVTTRMDANIYYPGDLARLAIEGTVDGETYQLDGIGADVSLFDELSLGWSGAILENLHVGARAKLLFGISSLSTTSSELSVTTSQDVWNIQSDMMFNASLPFADVRYDQDGLFDTLVINNDLDPPSASSIRGYVFNGGNMGLGVDLGVDYRPIEQLLISASVLDIGYIKWKEGIHEASYDMEFDFRGLEINPFEISEDQEFGDYMDSIFTQLGDSLSNFLTFTPGGVYSKRLNTKLFVGASYFVTPKINFGILSRTDFLGDQITQQVTATANLTTGRMVNFSLSYSYMNDYFKNFGAGLSLNAGPLNMYILSDNILNVVFWPQEARSVNLWFGMNLVFGYKKFMQAGSMDRPLLY